MRALVGVAIISMALLGLGTTAEAKGCLKGAAVGGVAGHFAGHHGLIGAAAGCVYGRHEANKRDRMDRNSNSRSDRLTNGQERM